MNFWQAVLMGIIQGLTEFLPVSSSGHLVMGKVFFGMNIDTSALFEALLHVGTLGAVFVYFWKDIKGSLRHRNKACLFRNIYQGKRLPALQT